MTWDEWKFSTRMAWEKPAFKAAGLGTLLVLLATSTYASVRIVGAGLPSGYAVTHYTIYLGIDQVVPVFWLALYIAVPILVISGTIACAMGLYRDDTIAGMALMVLAAASTVVWCVQLFYLSKINI